MYCAIFRPLLCIVVATALASATPSLAQTVLGKAVTATIADEVGVNSFTITTPPGSTAPVINDRWVQFNNSPSFDDGFGYMAVNGGNEGIDAVDPMPTPDFIDTSRDSGTETGTGVILDDDFDNFFGVQDLDNSDNPSGAPYSASWVFDITGASGALEMAVDIAAMGDFDDPPSDEYHFEYSFDGTEFSTALVTDTFNFDTSYTTDPSSFVNEIDQTVAGQDASELPPELVYEFASGELAAFNDPLTINGEFLNNDLQNFSAFLGDATSNELTVRFTATTNGDGKAFAFRNLTVSDGAVPPLAGDYNGDGAVNAADYTVWRDGGTLLNETETIGEVTEEDYDAWAANYGATGTGTAASIPEPTTAALALLAIAGLAHRRS